jgi:hypothetical protein
MLGRRVLPLLRRSLAPAAASPPPSSSLPPPPSYQGVGPRPFHSTCYLCADSGGGGDSGGSSGGGGGGDEEGSARFKCERPRSPSLP